MVMSKSYVHVSPINENWENIIIFDKPETILSKVKKLREGLPTWSNKTYHERATNFRKLIDLIQKNAELLNSTVRIETGKTEELCHGELNSAIRMLQLITSYEFFPSGKVLPSVNIHRQVIAERFPLGIALLIFPSNAPLPNFIWKLAPALMAGNVVLAKPSPFTGKSFEILLNLFRESGFDDSILQRIDTESDLFIDSLLKNLDLVSFTGSSKVGHEVLVKTSRYLPKLILECGGSNPYIVTRHSDLDSCIPIFCESAFGNAGQRCASASNVFVDENFFEIFINRVKLFMQNVTYGIEKDSKIGPMCSVSYVKKLEKQVANFSEVETVRLGKAKTINEFIFEPRLLLASISNHDFSDEDELYGPIAKVFPVKDLKESVELANQSSYGLTASVWTNSMTEASFARKALKYGVININGPTFGSEPNFPFGGYKLSGNGIKDAGYASIEEYSTEKVISIFQTRD
jgi:aldehyde dehydrogenase (NAD+)